MLVVFVIGKYPWFTMSEVVKQVDGVSNCVAMDANAEKLCKEDGHKDDVEKTDNCLVKIVGKTEAIKDLDLDEGELGGL